jgi:hypothetical protein
MAEKAADRPRYTSRAAGYFVEIFVGNFVESGFGAGSGAARMALTLRQLVKLVRWAAD